MAYPYFNPYYPQPMPDNLMQMRQMQQPQMQPMQQPMSQQVQQNPIAQSGVQWVSGEQEARGYLIAPNSAVALWDSTAPTVYLKQADASGKPTLKIYDLVERAETPSPLRPVCLPGAPSCRPEKSSFVPAVVMYPVSFQLFVSPKNSFADFTWPFSPPPNKLSVKTAA